MAWDQVWVQAWDLEWDPEWDPVEVLDQAMELCPELVRLAHGDKPLEATSFNKGEQQMPTPSAQGSESLKQTKLKNCVRVRACCSL